jgi:TP901 family phage tail tape measure protein
MASLGKDLVPASLTSAVGETEALAKAWGDVAKNSAAARRSLTGATSAAGRAALPPGGAGVVGGGGRGRLGGRLGMGGGSPGVHIPSGGHINTTGGAMAAAGLVGYAGYEAAEMEDAVFQLIYHSGVENNDANKAKFRKIVQDAMKTTGFGLHDIAESAKQEIRMFQGTPGGGIDVLPEMLKSAAIEARLKGESPEESMKALVGLAHMTKQYDPEQIKKLAPAFAFLSTANPGSLGSIEKAAGYAVPLLQSGMDVDPLDALLLGTALTRAGVTSTKSGTWLRQMALRAMPGSDYQSKKAFEAHESALQDFGLVDNKGKPTWVTNGKPDLFKMMDIASSNAAKIPLDKRAADEYALFGAQGGGGFALLSDPAVRQQVQSLRKEMGSDEFKNRYGSFLSNYNNQVTAQNARTGVQSFNVLMQNLGDKILPSVNQAFTHLTSVINTVTGLIPGAKGDGKVGGDVLTGATAGAGIGLGVGRFGGPVGALGGAAIGGILGGGVGVLEQRPLSKDVKEEMKDLLKRGPAVGSQLTVPPKAPPMHLNLNIDGRSLAQAVSEYQLQAAQFESGAPASDGSQVYGP